MVSAVYLKYLYQRWGISKSRDDAYDERDAHDAHDDDLTTKLTHNPVHAEVDGMDVSLGQPSSSAGSELQTANDESAPTARSAGGDSEKEQEQAAEEQLGSQLFVCLFLWYARPKYTHMIGLVRQRRRSFKTFLPQRTEAHWARAQVSRSLQAGGGRTLLPGARP